MTRHLATQVASVKEKKRLRVKKLGRLEYGAALKLQKETELAVRDGQQPDTLLLLEHPHTLTVGRRGDNAGILMSPELLANRGVTVFETNRGGKITYHGLGQIVGYPIINLSPEREDVHRYVRDLEEVLIRTLSDFDLKAWRIAGLTGVHTARGKVAAIGVHIARWVTTHGFALNVNTDLSFFDLIVACEGEPVTSMKELLGQEVAACAVEGQIVKRFSEVFEIDSIVASPLNDPEKLVSQAAARQEECNVFTGTAGVPPASSDPGIQAVSNPFNLDRGLLYLRAGGTSAVPVEPLSVSTRCADKGQNVNPSID